MDETVLRKKVIRLAHENKELRPHLLPLLVASEEDDDADKESIVMIQHHIKNKKKKGTDLPKDKESRYDEGPLSPSEKAELFRDNPEFADQHEKHKDVVKRLMEKKKQQ